MRSREAISIFRQWCCQRKVQTRVRNRSRGFRVVVTMQRSARLVRGRVGSGRAADGAMVSVNGVSLEGVARACYRQLQLLRQWQSWMVILQRVEPSLYRAQGGR